MMGGHGLQAVAKLGKSIKGLSMAMKQGNIARWAGTAGKGLRQLGMIGRSGLETLQIRAMYAGDGLRRLGATGRSALLRAGSATTRFASQLGRMAAHWSAGCRPHGAGSVRAWLARPSSPPHLPCPA